MCLIIYSLSRWRGWEIRDLSEELMHFLAVLYIFLLLRLISRILLISHFYFLLNSINFISGRSCADCLKAQQVSSTYKNPDFMSISDEHISILLSNNEIDSLLESTISVWINIMCHPLICFIMKQASAFVLCSYSIRHAKQLIY